MAGDKYLILYQFLAEHLAFISQEKRKLMAYISDFFIFAEKGGVWQSVFSAFVENRLQKRLITFIKKNISLKKILYSKAIECFNVEYLTLTVTKSFYEMSQKE